MCISPSRRRIRPPSSLPGLISFEVHPHRRVREEWGDKWSPGIYTDRHSSSLGYDPRCIFHLFIVLWDLADSCKNRRWRCFWYERWGVGHHSHKYDGKNQSHTWDITTQAHNWDGRVWRIRGLFLLPRMPFWAFLVHPFSFLVLTTRCFLLTHFTLWCCCFAICVVFMYLDHFHRCIMYIVYTPAMLMY